MPEQAQAFDILIIGAGISGLALARSLRDLDLQVALVDSTSPTPVMEAVKAADKAPKFAARVSALTVASVRLFQELEVWDQALEASVCPFRHMRVWDAEGTGQIHFSAADIHEPQLGVIAENQRILLALEQSVQGQANLSIVRPQQVASIDRSAGNQQQYRVQLESGRQLIGRLLVGADGARSLVRQAAGFKTREWEYGHQAIVTTVSTEQPHEFTAWQRFMPTGPLAFLPLLVPGAAAGGQHYSSIVWSCTPALADELMALDDEAFAAKLGVSFEKRLGDIRHVERRSAFPLRQMHATDYMDQGVVLAGDAAHTIHPLAGQGVNLGLQDIAALAVVLAQAVQSDEDIGSIQVLSRYQRRRKGANLAMMALMEGFKRLFESDDLLLRWLRNTGIDSVEHMPLIK
ncbi:MAG: UbiH/UbiF/VisC/COQ6 family ubiquinone biosynthesis hydroxylase, partial [Pseudohongiellaceae bacterium]